MEPPKTQLNGQTPTPQHTGAPPAKYIRTFETDMKTVQAKGTPDLTQLVETQESSESSELSELPTPIPEPKIEPTPAQTSEPAPAPTPKPDLVPVVPPPGLPELGMPSPIETYTSDFADRMKETKASTASIIAVEQDARSTPGAEAPTIAPRGNRLYIIGGAVLIVLGALGAYLAYARYMGATTPVVITLGVTAPIFVDDRVEVSGMGGALLQEIKQSTARPLAFNAVRLLYASTTADRSVFSLLDISAPSVLLRNITADGSMAGVVNAGGVQSPFFILSVSAYGTTFSGMLSWEVVMPRTLAGLFPAYPAPVVVASPVATSSASSGQATTTTPKTAKATAKPKAVATTTATTPPAPVVFVGFRDEVVANHDVRVYRDEKGRSVMLYGYWNQTTLVIARDPAAFSEILQRLATSHT